MMATLREFAVPILYIASAVFFIMGLKLMCRVRSARTATELSACNSRLPALPARTPRVGG